ncbi:MAG: 4-hydroxy-tetrahydrodipicolinate reductase [bacterium]
MIGVVVCGAAGRMGKMLSSALHSDGEFKIVGAVERGGHPDLGRDLGDVAGLGVRLGVRVGDSLGEVIGGGDVVIEFSAPDATLEHLRTASERGKAMVIGTTGMNEAQRKEIEELCRKIPCVMASNMSVGVNVLFKIVGDVARILGDAYDVEIIEIHHRFKKDAPSGTAKTLMEEVAKALGRDPRRVGVYGREGVVGERTKDEIGVLAARAGDIVGDHTVLFGGIGERIEIRHQAQSRMTFAQGALRAAKWVVGRPPGLYSMRDVLGL